MGGAGRMAAPFARLFSETGAPPCAVGLLVFPRILGDFSRGDTMSSNVSPWKSSCLRRAVLALAWRSFAETLDARSVGPDSSPRNRARKEEDRFEVVERPAPVEALLPPTEALP